MKNNLIKPKAYFIDIDGTLVSNHKDLNISADDYYALRKASRNKTYIILSTGRSLPDLKKVWEKINDDTEYMRYGVFNNGSGIYDFKLNQILFEEYMDETSYREVFEYSKKHNFAAKNSSEKVFYTNKNILSFVLGTFSKTNKISHNFEVIPYDKDSAKKIGIISTWSKRKVSKIANDIKNKIPNIDVAVSGPGLYIEINKLNINKGTAIKFFSDKLDFKIEETVHIGDSMNDAPAFEVAGYGVAMGNSMKQLKKKSDFITLSRKKSGVANTIKSFGNI